jgi:hypothetical protein
MKTAVIMHVLGFKNKYNVPDIYGTEGESSYILFQLSSDDDKPQTRMQVYQSLS